MSGLIYGFIQTYTTGLDAQAVYSHNQSALASLPSSGALIRPDMFHLLPLYESAITRHTQLIAFASENYSRYTMDAAWIAEFENLLRRLCWTSANAVETYCGNRFEWQAEDRRAQNQTDLFVLGWKRTVYDSYHDLTEVPFGPDGVASPPPRG